MANTKAKTTGSIDKDANAKIGRDRTLTWWLLAAIIIAAVAPYLPSLRGGFALDDYELIVNYPFAHSLANAPSTFTTSFLAGMSDATSAYHRPLSVITYQLNYAMFGPHPFGFRVTNLLIYALVAVLVFFVVKRLTKNAAIAGIAGLVFAVLPSHAESAAWVAGRTDLLAALFGLLSFLVFVASYQSRRFSWLTAGLSSMLLLAALLSKESAIAFPGLMLLYVWVYGSGSRRNEILKWVAALLPAVVIYLVLRRIALGVSTDANLTWMLSRRLLRVGIVYVQYLRMMFVPLEFRIDYSSYPVYTISPSPIVLMAELVPIALITLMVWTRKRLPEISFGVGWILIGLLPAADIIPTHSMLPTERFCFLASVGSSMILGWGVWRAYQCRPKSIRIWPLMFAIVGVAYLLNSAALAVQAAQVFQSNLSWAKHAAQTKSGWWGQRWYSGKYFAESGYMEMAAAEYKAAMKCTGIPRYYKGYVECDLGVAYVGVRDMKRAASAFSRAVHDRPDLGRAWRNLARADLSLQRYSEAVTAYERAKNLGAMSKRDKRDYEIARAGASRR